MADCYDAQTRHRVMQSIRSKSTKLEIKVRTALRTLGFRYLLNRKRLPGSPDIVLPRYNIIIMVNGCFWHQHPGCKLSKLPKTNRKFWKKKFAGNLSRDERNLKNLKEMGWRVLIVWECQIARKGQAVPVIENLLKPWVPQNTVTQLGLFEAGDQAAPLCHDALMPGQEGTENSGNVDLTK